jgi:hypothetical protein
MTVTPEFKEASTRAAIRGLRGLEQTAIMLETYAPDLYPEINGKGQKHFGRVMMESAAQSIRDAWKGAIVEVEAFPDTPASIIEQRGKLRQALLSVATLLYAVIGPDEPQSADVVLSNAREAASIARDALQSSLVKPS